MKSLLLSLVFFFAHTALGASGQILFAAGDSSAAFNKFLQSVEQIVPSLMKNYLTRKNIAFKDWGPVPNNLCSKDVDLNRLVKKDPLKFKERIFLAKVLEPYLKGHTGRAFPCKDLTAQQLATKALLFALAKEFDKAESHWDNKLDKAARRTCEIQRGNQREQKNQHLSTLCHYYLKNSFKVSGAPQYKNLADYKGKLIESKNKLPLRLLSDLETTSPEDHFAVNLAQYLMDPEYLCRRPALHGFFKKLTGGNNLSGQNCQKLTHIYTSTAAWKIDIAPEKVYQVHYLFAAKGEELMSRWGHSMLRLVVCAPSRTEVGPACLDDVAYHVVLSYRANVDDVIVNYWDGLTGEYPSQLMVFSMPEIVDEYTRAQWRDLISLPLKLSRNDQKTLIESALEHYWSYSGEYKFLTNNCASEVDQLLRAALAKNHPYQNSFASSPLGVYKNLARFRLIDLALVADKKEAQAKTYFFPSQKHHLERAFQKMQNYFPEYTSLSDFAFYSQSLERRSVYESMESFEDLGSAYLLEKYISSVQQGQHQRLLSQLLQNNRTLPQLDDLIRKIVESSQQRLPWKMARVGYGIPLAEDGPSDEAISKNLQEAIKWNVQYRETVLRAYPQIDTELKEIKKNLELLTNLRRF